jgi:hypothetical protein
MSATRHGTGRRGHAAALGTAGWLGLAAAPTFAVMGLLTYVIGGGADMMCPDAHGVSALGGMVPMYVLMSAFHSVPWLKLISRRRSAACRSSQMRSDGARVSEFNMLQEE